MPVAGSGGYVPGPSSDDKKKNKGSGSSFTPSPTAVEGGTTKGPSSAPVQYATSGVKPPSYSQPLYGPATGKPYRDTFFPKSSEPAPTGTDFFKDLLANLQRPRDPQPTGTDDLGKLLKQPLRSKGDPQPVDAEDGLSPQMQKFLESLKQNSTNKAPDGYALGDEKREDGMFAWVPEKYRTRGLGKDSRLKDHWDREFIESRAAQYGTDPDNAWRVDKFLNDMMELQYNDREKWLFERGQRKTDRIEQVLGNAEQAAFEGDFEFLERKLDKRPNLLDVPRYREDFGFTPEQIDREYEKQAANLSDEEWQAGRYRIDAMIDHYKKVREGYHTTKDIVDGHIERYEKKYNESLEHWTDEDRNFDDDELDLHEKAKKAGPAIPSGKPGGLPEDEQAVIDGIADKADPRGQDWASFYGTGRKKQRKSDREAIDAVKREAQAALGTVNIPSVKEMLAAAVASGRVDPKDEAAVEAMIERFRNPNHPDTRAMYVAFASHKNPALDMDRALEFVNAPVEQYVKELSERSARNAELKEQEDKSTTDGIIDAFTDQEWSFTGMGIQPSPPGMDEDTEDAINNGGLDLGWTFDKLARFNYSMAGMADAYYGLEEDTPSLEWHDALWDWPSSFTGQSSVSVWDEIANNPSGALYEIADAGYQQFFRGSDLPGIRSDEDIVPTTFATVIANNAARDPENNLYDKAWYQHTAGFVMDVAFDPLNYIGVGMVGNTLKIPTRAMAIKSVNDTKRSLELTPEDVLRKITSPGSSPLAEHVFRIDQSIRRIGEPTRGGNNPYVADKDIWSRHLLDEDLSVKYINRQLEALRAQEIKVKNDIGLQAMDDVLAEAAATTPKIAWDSQIDVRIGRVLGQTDNGADIFKRYLGAMDDAALTESAKRGGAPWAHIEFEDTTLGRAAKDAHEQLDELDAAVASGKFDANSTAVANKREQLQRIIDEGNEIDPATGKPGWTTKANREEYVNAGMPGFRPNFDPVNVLAKSVNMTRDDFARAFDSPNIDLDVQRAFALGGDMLIQQDPIAAKIFFEGAERVREAKKVMARTANKDEIARAQRALDHGYKMMNEVKVGGALRYLDTLQSMRRSGVRTDVPLNASSKPKKGQKKKIQQKIDELNVKIDQLHERIALGRTDIPEAVNREFFEDFSTGGGLRVEGRDVDNSYIPSGQDDLGDYYGSESLGIGPRSDDAAHPLQQQLDELTAKRDEFADELKALDEWEPEYASEWPTALNPQQVERLEDILPVDSVLRNAEGKLHVEKIKAVFKIENHSITYKTQRPDGKPWTPQEHDFLTRIRNNLTDTYNLAYRKAKTEMKQVVDEGTPKGPGPRERALGPRPTGANVVGSKAAFKPEKRKERLASDGTELKPGEIERAHVTFEGLEKSGPRAVIQTDEFKEWSKSDQSKFREATARKEAAERKGDAEAVRRHEQTIDDLYRKNTRGKVIEGDYVPKAVVKSDGVIDTGGHRTRHQTNREQWIKNKQKQYDKDLARARELDAADSAGRWKPTPEQSRKIADMAWQRTVNALSKDLERGTLPAMPGNIRLTINQKAGNLRKSVNEQYRADDVILAVKQNEAAKAKNVQELERLKAQRAILRQERIKYLKLIEQARRDAHAVRVSMDNVIKEEHVLQMLDAAPQLNTKAISIHLMGMQKNLQWTNAIFRGAEKAAKLVPAKTRESFANTFVRPTKQVRTQESIYFRAKWAGNTPVIIKGHLENLNKSFDNVMETERIEMFSTYRNGGAYEGPNMHQYDAAMEQVRGIERIFNGKDPEYGVRVSRNDTEPTPLSVGDIYHFLPAEYKPNMGELWKMVHQDGGFTAENILKAIQKTPGNKVGHLRDPYRFAHVMRVAADQAHAYRGLINSVEGTFGIRVTGNTSRKAIAKKLERDHGWRKVKGYGDDVIFPPQSVKEVQTLLELAKPSPKQAEFLRVVDAGLGFWKQSMTIYNPGYYARNGVGEIMVSFLDGVKNPKYYRRAGRIIRFVNGADRPLADLVKNIQGLDGKVPVDVTKANEIVATLKGGRKITVQEGLRYYVDQGLASTFANTDLGRGVRSLAGSSMAKSKTRRAARKINEKVHEKGEHFEDYLRMAHFLHAMEHSGYANIEKAAMYAAERVRRSHFDYTDFSKAEQAVMLRAFPFFKWTRRGAPLMLAHLFMTPGKMVALPKTLDYMSDMGFDPVGIVTDDPVLSTQDVHADDNGVLPNYQGIAPGWVRDLFAYQIAPAPDDEYANYMRIATPQVDALNAVFQPLDSAILPLMNPAVKGALELGRNRSLDPDFPYEIYGGDYNEMNGINPVESLINYTARMTNPVAGFLTKLSKNGDLGPLSMGDGSYRDSKGYDAARDVASFATGMGFYQAMPGDAPTETGANTRAVGMYGLDEIPEIRGRKAAADSGVAGKPKGEVSAPESIEDVIGAIIERASGSSNGDGNGWVDFGSRGGWRNFGGGFGGGFSSGGFGGGGFAAGGGSGSGMEFMELIAALKAMIDQGEVY